MDIEEHIFLPCRKIAFTRKVSGMKVFFGWLEVDSFFQ